LQITGEMVLLDASVVSPVRSNFCDDFFRQNRLCERLYLLSDVADLLPSVNFVFRCCRRRGHENMNFQRGQIKFTNEE